MPSLTQIRDAAVDTLKTVCPVKQRVKAFSGKLDLDSAKSKNLPAGVSVLVAALEAVNGQPNEQLDLTGVLVAQVVSVNAANREIREADALKVAEIITPTIHGSKFGLIGVSPALVAALTPLDNDKLDAAGIAVWLVVWQQAFTFDLHKETP